MPPVVPGTAALDLTVAAEAAGKLMLGLLERLSARVHLCLQATA
jgi:hypothetical protein